MVEIRISDLTHEFDDREVLQSLDFTCGASSLAVTGPNGSGKSTLLRILAGLLTPISGKASVFIDGAEVAHDALRYQVGLAAPDVRLYADLSARENLRFLLKARVLHYSEELVEDALTRVGLVHRGDDRIYELSSGLRQRAALAAGIVHNPDLLLLDEPSTNLDEEGISMVRSVVEAQKERGMVIIATNDSREVELASQRLDLGSVNGR